jgi:hypothetical protein
MRPRQPHVGLDVTASNSMFDLDVSPPQLTLGRDATTVNSKLGLDTSVPHPSGRV